MDNNSIKEILKIVDNKRLKTSGIKNILITGCSGFIGTYLINTLLNEQIKNKFQIFGVDIAPPKYIDNTKKKFFFIKKDLYNTRSFSIKNSIDLVIHLAGIPSPTYYKLKPLQTFYLNSELTKIFLEFAKQKKSRFIYFSSSEIYGNPDTRNIPTTEDYEGRVSSLGDRSCYDESKRSGETYTWIFNDFYGVKTSIIRPFNFYGNGMKKNDKRVIPQFFNTAINKNKILPFGNGKQTRSYCHIIDAIPQIINVSFFGKSLVYNIGNPNEELSANNLAMIIKRILNLKNIKITPTSYPKSYPANEPLRRCPSILKLKKEFNYKPSINIEKGLLLFAQYAKGKF
mgnify:CR=1 FL=1